MCFIWNVFPKSLKNIDTFIYIAAFVHVKFQQQKCAKSYSNYGLSPLFTADYSVWKTEEGSFFVFL